MSHQNGLNYAATNRQQMIHLLEISRQNWLLNLKAHNIWNPNLNNPAEQKGWPGAAWTTYEEFVGEVMECLEENGELATELLLHGFLDNAFRHFHARKYSKKWITFAMTHDPAEHSPEQVQFANIVRMQRAYPAEGSLLLKIRGVELGMRDWMESAYDSVKVQDDPNPNWLFLERHRVRHVPQEEAEGLVAQNAECPICCESYTFDNEADNYPTRGPCPHILCFGCVKKWVTEACHGDWTLNLTHKFTCPLCRACLVCGVNNCDLHVLDHGEEVQPILLTPILHLFHGASSHPLHGLTPPQYHHLRQFTRRMRTSLARMDVLLGPDGIPQGDNWNYCGLERSNMWKALAKEVKKFMAKPRGYTIYN